MGWNLCVRASPAVLDHFRPFLLLNFDNTSFPNFLSKRFVQADLSSRAGSIRLPRLDERFCLGWTFRSCSGSPFVRGRERRDYTGAVLGRRNLSGLSRDGSWRPSGWGVGTFGLWELLHRHDALMPCPSDVLRGISPTVPTVLVTGSRVSKSNCRGQDSERGHLRFGIGIHVGIYLHRSEFPSTMRRDCGISDRQYGRIELPLSGEPGIPGRNAKTTPVGKGYDSIDSPVEFSTTGESQRTTRTKRGTPWRCCVSSPRWDDFCKR